MKKILTFVILCTSLSINAMEVEVKSTLVDYPTFQGVVTMNGLTANGCWNAVASYLYSAYGRSIRSDISEGNDFTTKNLKTITTYKNGLQIVFSYSISFEFREGRFRYTYYVNDYYFTQGSEMGTENYNERPTDKAAIIQEMNKTFIGNMYDVGKFAYDDNW